MLKINKTEVMKNTMRNSKIMDPAEMERLREESKKKYQNMNKSDLMKLDGVSGFKKNNDDTSSISKSDNSQNENESDKKSSEESKNVYLNKSSKSNKYSNDVKSEKIKNQNESVIIQINSNEKINDSLVSLNPNLNKSNLSGFAKKIHKHHQIIN